ncbi:Aste57867_20155 [Aphanomyces stellatus]|uniref:Aste57867_20155 protein n=1 Tax=Aphanomyces stellatus TaxID=120398 RepID=A0A485LF16_9STRA|nr:hypothetical protein As57867_020089 [Aphanomyces stellatus]VFT96850.1 Aste57867_20155 [Aphanomyces stellatus]
MGAVKSKGKKEKKVTEDTSVVAAIDGDAPADDPKESSRSPPLVAVDPPTETSPVERDPDADSPPDTTGGGDHTINDSIKTSELTDLAASIVVVAPPPPPSLVGMLTLPDQSTYHGQLNPDQAPHGVGCLYFVAGGYYAGDFVDGKRHGAGVYGFPDGSRYEGDFVQDLRDGYGVYMVTVGEKYRGQWRDNAQDGLGEWTAWDGTLTLGEFKQNDLVGSPCDDDIACTEEVRRASLAQQHAIVTERRARVQERLAYAQDNMSIGQGVFIQDDAAFDQFDTAAQHRQRAYVAAWQRDFDAVETSTQEGKTEEATLGERQKQLHETIRTRRAELARHSMFWDIVLEKEKAFVEAKRILASIEMQIRAEEAVDDRVRRMSSSVGKPPPPPPRPPPNVSEDAVSCRIDYMASGPVEINAKDREVNQANDGADEPTEDTKEDAVATMVDAKPGETAPSAKDSPSPHTPQGIDGGSTHVVMPTSDGVSIITQDECIATQPASGLETTDVAPSKASAQDNQESNCTT